MAATNLQTVPTLRRLPATLPREGAIEIELEQGVLVFRVTQSVQDRIESLLDKQREANLTSTEEEELQQYEEVDDYLSFLNRLIRNLAQFQQQGLISAS
ncbi:MAG: hypothetical protein ACREEM_45805 [Blastocatellia bacterium]